MSPSWRPGPGEILISASREQPTGWPIWLGGFIAGLLLGLLLPVVILWL